MSSVALSDYRTAEGRSIAGNRCYGYAGLADHGSHVDVLTANAVSYSINGVMYTLAAQTAIDLSAAGYITEDGVATTLAALADGYTAVYLLVVNAAGTIKVIQSDAVANGGDIYCPRMPESLYAPIGYFKVVNTSGSAYTVGTTDKSGTGVTDTYASLATIPVGTV